MKLLTSLALSSLCLMPLTTLSEGSLQPLDYFSGAYLGAGLGVGGVFTKASLTYADNSVVNNDQGNFGFAGQAFIGYGQVFNQQFYLGAEVAYLYQGAKPTYNHTDLDTGSNDTTHLVTSDKNNLNLLAHLGYLLNDKSLGYLIAGAAYGTQKAELTYTDSNTPANTFSGNTSSSRWGWVLGLGGMLAMNDHLLLGSEIQYANFGKINNSFANAITAVSARNRTWTALVRAAYRFDA